MFRGIVTSAVTLPFASARNGKSWMTLSSWILPLWFVGTWVAVTTTESPAVTVDCDSERVGVGGLAAYQIAPMVSSTRRIAAAQAAITLRRDRGSAACWAGAGQGIATVALGFTASASVGMATAAGATALWSSTVEARCGAVTIVPAGSDSSASPAATASTKAVQLSQRTAGSFARPRRIAASSAGLRDLLCVLGGSGSRCTCA
jgi:hypothetical protein